MDEISYAWQTHFYSFAGDLHSHERVHCLLIDIRDPSLQPNDLPAIRKPKDAHNNPIN